MESGFHFKRNGQKAPPYYSGANIEDRFLDCLKEEVMFRFERPSNWRVNVTSMPLWGNGHASATPPPNFICSDCPYPATQPGFWQEHLLELHQHHSSHWCQCEAERWCAMVPVVYGNICLALFNVACPSSVDETELVRKVEMLEILTEHFLQRYDDLVEKLAKQNGRGVILAQGEYEKDQGLQRAKSHPKLLKAFHYIRNQLSNPQLSVADVADALDINSTYLAHLFAQRVGVRMSRYIAMQRVEQAKELLGNTDWPIKRVAFESGFRNSDWFSQVFRSYTGMTPRVYRKRSKVEAVYS